MSLTSMRGTFLAAPARQLLLLRGLHRARHTPSGQPLTRAALSDLHIGWGNRGWSADIDYLEAVAREAEAARGPILECGSGLTTIVLGLVAGRRGISVWSLEHDADWGRRVRRRLRRHRVLGVEVVDAPLQSYGEFDWYTPSRDLPSEFDLVVCDGPPGDTRGGRLGLLPIMDRKLMSGATILLDDAGRPGEQEVLASWQARARLDVSVERTSKGSMARVVLLADTSVG